MRYEYYSNLALVSSVVVYALAMFAHAAEWAAARRVSVAERGEPELVNVRASERTEMRPEPVEGCIHACASTSSARMVCRRVHWQGCPQGAFRCDPERDNRGRSLKRPLINASFFSRRHPLILCLSTYASSMCSHS